MPGIPSHCSFACFVRFVRPNSTCLGKREKNLCKQFINRKQDTWTKVAVELRDASLAPCADIKRRVGTRSRSQARSEPETTGMKPLAAASCQTNFRTRFIVVVL